MWLNVSSKGWLSRWHQSLPWRGGHNFLLEALRFEVLLHSRRLCVAVWIYERHVVFMESVRSVVFQNLIFVCLTNLVFTTKTNKGEKMFVRRSFSTKDFCCLRRTLATGLLFKTPHSNEISALVLACWLRTLKTKTRHLSRFKHNRLFFPVTYFTLFATETLKFPAPKFPLLPKSRAPKRIVPCSKMQWLRPPWINLPWKQLSLHLP